MLNNSGHCDPLYIGSAKGKNFPSTKKEKGSAGKMKKPASNDDATASSKGKGVAGALKNLTVSDGSASFSSDDLSLTLTEAYMSVVYLHLLLFDDIPLGSAENQLILTMPSLSPIELLNTASDALSSAIRDSGADAHRQSTMEYYFGTVLLKILEYVRETLVESTHQLRLSTKDGLSLKISLKKDRKQKKDKKT